MTFFQLDRLPVSTPAAGTTRRAVWLNRLMITFFSFQPHAIVPDHAHPHEQITLVTKGAMEFTLQGETRVLRAGDGVCIPSDAPHRAVILDEPTEAIDAWSPPRDDYKGA